jgi:hypothetical protein
MKPRSLAQLTVCPCPPQYHPCQAHTKVEIIRCLFERAASRWFAIQCLPFLLPHLLRVLSLLVLLLTRSHNAKKSMCPTLVKSRAHASRERSRQSFWYCTSTLPSPFLSYLRATFESIQLRAPRVLPKFFSRGSPPYCSRLAAPYHFRRSLRGASHLVDRLGLDENRAAAAAAQSQARTFHSTHWTCVVPAGARRQ